MCIKDDRLSSQVNYGSTLSDRCKFDSMFMTYELMVLAVDENSTRENMRLCLGMANVFSVLNPLITLVTIVDIYNRLYIDECS